MQAFMFPGQGSQKRGMGLELFDSDDFRRHETEITEILGYSVKALCTEDPEQELNKTQYTQPALYVVNYLAYRRALREGQRPHYMAGHSLGELNALQAAGAFPFRLGLQIVQKRGELMSQAATGAMAAIVGLSPSDILDMLFSNSMTDIDVANLNAPTQTVVSGSCEAIDRLEHIVKRKAAPLFFRLPVSAAFHSRHMKKAAEEFHVFLKGFEFSELRVPVISNVTARPYPSGNETLRTGLSEQIVRPVRWSDSIKYLVESGVTAFTEIGLGNVLSRLNDQITADV